MYVEHSNSNRATILYVCILYTHLAQDLNIMCSLLFKIFSSYISSSRFGDIVDNQLYLCNICNDEENADHRSWASINRHLISQI